MVSHHLLFRLDRAAFTVMNILVRVTEQLKTLHLKTHPALCALLILFPALSTSCFCLILPSEQFADLYSPQDQIGSRCAGLTSMSRTLVRLPTPVMNTGLAGEGVGLHGCLVEKGGWTGTRTVFGPVLVPEPALVHWSRSVWHRLLR